MILQTLLFPKAGICTVQGMYFRNDKAETDLVNATITFNKDGKTSFDTYFNSFSIEKWKKYTILKDLKLRLKLKGKFEVTLLNKEINNKIVMEWVNATFQVDSEEMNTYEFAFLPFHIRGMLCFKLKALSDDAVYYGGEYFTDIDETTLPEICIALGICTFKREIFIENNLKILNDYILKNENSPMYGHLQVYIADNGKSLDEKLSQTDTISIFANKNAGGAGGFTRSLMEVIVDKDKKGITHVLFMDDDIVIEPEAIVKTYTLLRLLKKEYQESSIGGAMLKLDKPFLQQQAGAVWNGEAVISRKTNLDLRPTEKVLKNEIEETIEYIAWWYCCMPLSLISPDNLPLPIFISYDDVEYCLRICKQLIVMNGICVWHEPFENKYSSFQEYYKVRNILIINSLHRKNYGPKQIKKSIFKRIIKNGMRYRYKDIALCFQAVKDYCQGIDWLINQEPEELHNKVVKNGYIAQPIEKLSFNFVYGDYEKSLNHKKGRKLKIKRILSLNGYLLRAKKSAIVPMSNPWPADFYKVRRVLNYDEISKKGFITTKSCKQMFQIYLEYRKICKLIDQRHAVIKEEYNNRFREITNMNFWKKYLDIKGSSK